MMPMGLRSAAYAGQRVSNSIVFMHRQFGYWSINYLDDFGSAEKKEDDANDSFNLMTRIMKSIGVAEAEEKAIAPTTRLDFLGNTIDSVKMTLEVSAERKVELMELIQCWLKRDSF